jgi:hypothetical protein
MDECDLEPKEALPRSLVDQLGPFGREPPELHEDILDLVGDMVHSRAALCEEPADRRFFTERRKQLDAARADQHGCGLDALFVDTCAVLERSAEQALVGVERVVQVVNGDAEVMDAADAHGTDATEGLVLCRGESAHGADRLGRTRLRSDVAEQLVELLAVQRFTLEQLRREAVE